MIVLIIDEAQHAITSDAGVAALFALKAARDELDSSRHHGLRVVCTGSNRDKLAMLRNSKDQAFFMLDPTWCGNCLLAPGTGLSYLARTVSLRGLTDAVQETTASTSKQA